MPRRVRAVLAALAIGVGIGLAACTGGGGGRPVGPTPSVVQPSGRAATAQVAERVLTFVDSRRGRTIETHVFYPDIGSQAGSPFPIVVFSHGLTSHPDRYLVLLRHWVHAGFVVVAPVYPFTNRDAPDLMARDVVNQPADASFVLTQVLALGQRDGDTFHGLLDPNHIAAAGHSAGAITSIGLLKSCCRDTRIDGAIALAGNELGFRGEDWAGPPVPVLFLHGTDDHTVPLPLGLEVYDSLPWPKAFVELLGADHASPYVAVKGAAGAVVLNTTTDFLQWVLYRDPAALPALKRDATVAGVADITSTF
jgi:dienelactone hydrolase